jgi:hypothetical protein
LGRVHTCFCGDPQVVSTFPSSSQDIIRQQLQSKYAELVKTRTLHGSSNEIWQTFHQAVKVALPAPSARPKEKEHFHFLEDQSQYDILNDVTLDEELAEVDPEAARIKKNRAAGSC